MKRRFWPPKFFKRKHRKKRVEPAHSRGQLPRILLRIYFAAGLMVVMTLLGTLGFLWIGRGTATFSDALYMTLITITTVGYGEVVPLHGIWARLFAGLIAFAGFGAVTFLFTSLTVFFLESDFDVSLRRRRMNKKIDRLNNHFIVCGYGRVGQNVGGELIATGRPFVAIEQDLPLLLELADRDDRLIWQHGDATDDDQLISAGIDRAIGIFAVSNDDAKNMMIALTAKQLNPKLRVVARCHEVRNEEKLKKAGADQVVLPDFTGGTRIVTMMVRPHLANLLEEMQRSDQKVRMEETPIPHRFTPRPLGNLKLRSPEYVLVAVRIGKDWHFNPQDDFELHPGQVLVTMTTPAGRMEFEELLKNA
ncbi:potassium channel family protein [Uliginosibacterium gangwonense]|uniref:potassium channel family protein n=1 Tax=Uliginosibacterium gangwonense TaxID=392736 RepID=UPI00036B7C0F|nr:potassium channel protein [Uliginosibacterium gangwonense]